MRRICSVLTFLALVASACGSDSSTIATPEPDGTDDAPARLATPETSEATDPCDGLRGVLEDLEAILDAGDEAYASRLAQAIEPLDADAAASVLTLVELGNDRANEDRALGLIADVDAATFAACELPAISAGVILANQSTPQTSCAVGEPIGDDTQGGPRDEPCPSPPPPLPTVLPCFHATGVPFLLDPLGAYEAVDCESREPVHWDDDWIVSERPPAPQTFLEIDSAIS